MIWDILHLAVLVVIAGCMLYLVIRDLVDLHRERVRKREAMRNADARLVRMTGRRMR